MRQTILSAGGDAAVRSGRNEVLRAAGFEILETHTGADVLRLALEHRPTLIVLAIELFGADGFTICVELKADPRTASIPVLHIHKVESPRVYLESLESGAEGYLQEPVEPPILVGAVTALIRRQSAKATTLKGDQDAALRESEARFRSVLEGSRDVIYRLNVQTGRFEYISPSAETVVGFSAEELMAQDYEAALAMIHPDDRHVMVAALARLYETGSAEAEYRQIAKSGEYLWLSNSMSLTNDCAGQPRYRNGSIRDITDRKAGEEALRDSEERLRMVIENSRDGINMLDLATGRYVLMSPAQVELTGFTAEEINNISAEEALQRVHPDDRGISLAQQKLLASGQDLSGPAEYRWRVKSGEYRWFSDSRKLVRDAQGRPVALVGTSRDITSQKQADEALWRASEQRRLALEAAALGSWDYRFQTGEVFWDERCRNLFGVPSGDQVPYGGAIACIHPADRAAVDEAVKQAIAGGGGGAYFREFRVIWPDGSVHWVASHGRVYFEGEGKSRRAVRCIGVNMDISERRQSEERLRQAQKLQSLGLLAGGVAHDFNNLLVGVIGNASLAQESLPPEHPAAELLDGVLKSGEQAAHLTRQMLAYSGRGKFVVEALNLSALIPEMCGLVRPSIPKKIALKFDLEQSLPAIEADRGQVEQVFMNLALNAAEAIGSHEGLISIGTGVQDVDEAYTRLHPELAELAAGKYVCLEVRDTGCGMDEATRAKIFDPFFSTKFIGRGLGLAAVSGIVRGHQGAIEARSAPGQGSCFTVLFPAAERAAESPVAVSRAVEFEGAGTVLVVDDEQIVREMAKRALERHGYTVLVADSGAAAIDVFRRHPGEIAVVLLDLSMPGMSGEETLPELRKIRPKFEVVVSSGYSESEAMTLFHGQRVSGFVQKPYTSKGIAEKVKACLKSRG